MSPDLIQQTEVLIVGAGPAGLAVGACLQRAGIPFVILEAAGQVGASWRQHYDRLHLHTDKGHSQLPFFPYPKGYPRYPSRNQVIDYLEAYARHFNLQPRFGQKVELIQRQDGLWRTRTTNATYLSPFLVIATGNNRQPFMPMWPGQEKFSGEILHSSAYRNGQAFQGKHVLVVGFGNSGGEIAVDLWEQGAKPAMAVRSPVNLLSRDLFGLPLLNFAIPLSKLPARLADLLVAPIMRLHFGNLARLGLRKLPYGAFTQVAATGKIPLIDIGTVKLIRQGHIQVYPEIERFEQGEAVFSDQRRQRFDAVILATGFRPSVAAFLEGTGAGEGGGDDKERGLHFCGFHVTATGMLRELALEAERISAEIARARAGT